MTSYTRILMQEFENQVCHSEGAILQPCFSLTCVRKKLSDTVFIPRRKALFLYRAAVRLNETFERIHCSGEHVSDAGI